MLTVLYLSAREPLLDPLGGLLLRPEEGRTTISRGGLGVVSASEKVEAKKHVLTFADIWAWKDDEVKTSSETAYHIDTGGQEPIKEQAGNSGCRSSKWVKQGIAEPHRVPGRAL